MMATKRATCGWQKVELLTKNKENNAAALVKVWQVFYITRLTILYKICVLNVVTCAFYVVLLYLLVAFDWLHRTNQIADWLQRQLLWKTDLIALRSKLCRCVTPTNKNRISNLLDDSKVISCGKMQLQQKVFWVRFNVQFALKNFLEKN